MEEKDLLPNQLHETIAFMMEKRIIDHRFAMVYTLEETTGSFTLDEMIAHFCDETQKSLDDLTEALNESVWDYCIIKMHFYRIKRYALCMGAPRLSAALSAFQGAIDRRSKEFCLLGLNGAKIEFAELAEKLHVILQAVGKVPT